jgi:hypothetical protein
VPFSAVGSQTDGRGVTEVGSRVRCAVRGFGTTIDCDALHFVGAVVAGVLLCACGAAAGREDRLRPVISAWGSTTRCGKCGAFHQPSLAVELRCSAARQFFCEVWETSHPPQLEMGHVLSAGAQNVRIRESLGRGPESSPHSRRDLSVRYHSILRSSQ